MDSKYVKADDNELITMFREGDADAEECLLERYKALVRSKAGAMYMIGGERSDLIQEGMIGLMKAVRGFDEGRDSSFAGFAELCVSRQMYTAVEASNRKKHIPLNSSISLNEDACRSGDSTGSLLDMFQDTQERDPEALLIDREDAMWIDAELDKSLSRMEREVLDLYLAGFGYVQIAEITGRQPKQTDNALQRIRGKLRHILEEKE